MSNVRRALIVLALASLVGCVHDPRGPCPISGILSDAETMTAFAGGGHSPADAAAKVTLSNIRLTCTNNPTRQRLDASVSFTVALERGPAGKSAPVTVPYFVAVSRGGKVILAREAYNHTFGSGSGATASARETIERVRIPLADKTTGASYEVVVGLILTPDQLAFNRARHGP